MKRHLKLAALASACMMVMSIVGCTSAEGKSTPTPAAPTPTAPAAVEPTPAVSEPEVLDASAMYRGHNSGLTNRTAAEGYYVQYLAADQLEEALFGPLKHEGSEVSCFQINTLVLTNNEFASRGNCQFFYEPGQRYEFTKDFRDTQRGMHFIFSFYGTYTVDGDQVTLSKPETFCYNLWTGDGGPIAEPTDAGGFCSDPETDPYADAMNTAIMNYRCAYGHEEMTVTIDQENFSFTVNEVNEDD